MMDMNERTNENERAAERTPDDGKVESRRRVLKLGALAVPAVATLSPNMAMATYGGGSGGGTPPVGGAGVSLMACTVPMPEFIDEKGFPVDRREVVRKSTGKYYRKDEKGNWLLVYSGPAEGSYSGQQIKDALTSWSPPPGVGQQEFQAHVQYLTKVRYQQVNGAGLTCLISLTSNLDAYRA